MGEILWVAGTFVGASTHLERALEAAPDDQALAARLYPKLVYFNAAHDPARAVELADAAIEMLDPGAGLPARSPRWSSTDVGEPGARRRSTARAARAMAGARGAGGPGRAEERAPAHLLPLIDDFEAARAASSVEDQWYRVRGEDDWRAERRAHRADCGVPGGAVGPRRGAARGEQRGDRASRRPGPWAMVFRFRSIVDAGRGQDRAGARDAGAVDRRTRARRAPWRWEALMLSASPSSSSRPAIPGGRECALTRMDERIATIGVRELASPTGASRSASSRSSRSATSTARGACSSVWRSAGAVSRACGSTSRCLAPVRSCWPPTATSPGALAALDALDETEAAKLPFDLGLTLLTRGRLNRRARQRRAAADDLEQALQVFERLGAPTGPSRRGPSSSASGCAARRRS